MYAFEFWIPSQRNESHKFHEVQISQIVGNPQNAYGSWRFRTRGIHYRGRFDRTPDVVSFADILESVCVKTVESGFMTKDLALLIGPEHDWMTTQQFLAKIDENLQRAMK